MTTPVQPGDIATDLVVPQRGDPPAIFTPQYQTFLDRMNGEVIPAMNALSAYFNESNAYTTQQVALAADQVTLAADQVSLAADQVSLAAEQVSLAAEQAGIAKIAASDASATSNFAGEWSGLSGVLPFPSSLYHNGSYWVNLFEIPNVELSEPSFTNSDYKPLTLNNARLGITTPFTVTLPGKYFIRDSGVVTMPSIAGLQDESFSFVSAIGESPTVNGAGVDDILTSKYGLVDGVVLDNQAVYEFVYNPISGKLEV